MKNPIPGSLPTWCEEMRRQATYDRDGGRLDTRVDNHCLLDLLDLLEACRVALGAQQAQHWQPIDTAPKDGTPVLVLAADNERFVGCWKRGGWELFGAYARIAPVYCWMPLADPPVVAEGIGRAPQPAEEQK
jgi:hypothetical protein